MVLFAYCNAYCSGSLFVDFIPLMKSERSIVYDSEQYCLYVLIIVLCTCLSCLIIVSVLHYAYPSNYGHLFVMGICHWFSVSEHDIDF